MQSIAGRFQKFVDITQQYFAFTPQANFPAYNLNCDENESRLHFKTFCSLRTQLEVQEFVFLNLQISDYFKSL